MRCTVKDKATPKTGGVTNRVQPTAASRFKPGISKSGGRIYALCPIMRNEANLTKPTAQKYETNPISSPLLIFSSPILHFSTTSLLHFCPYPPTPVSTLPRWPKVSPDLSGNPISACRHPQSTIYDRQYTIPWPNLPPHTRPTTQNTKRTQFRSPTNKKRETNPIPEHAASRHPLFQRNGPNFRRAGLNTKD